MVCDADAIALPGRLPRLILVELFVIPSCRPPLLLGLYSRPQSYRSFSRTLFSLRTDGRTPSPSKEGGRKCPPYPAKLHCPDVRRTLCPACIILIIHRLVLVSKYWRTLLNVTVRPGH